MAAKVLVEIKDQKAPLSALTSPFMPKKWNLLLRGERPDVSTILFCFLISQSKLSKTHGSLKGGRRSGGWLEEALRSILRREEDVPVLYI